MSQLKDRVKDTTTTTGTGNITLSGTPPTGFDSFSSRYATNIRFPYAIVGGAEYEVGVGYLSAATTLVRETVTQSSNADALVNFSAGTKDVFVSATASNLQRPRIQTKTGAYTVDAGDIGTIIYCTTNSFTVSLTAAATLGAGFHCWIINANTAAANAITIDPNGAETIDGATTLLLRRGEGLELLCDGSGFYTVAPKRPRGFAENFTATDTRPVASGDSSVCVGTYTTASGTASAALGYNSTASNTAAVAIGSGATASSTNAFAAGRNSGSTASQAVTGSGAMALGGSYASGTDSFAAAIANNTSTYGAQGANSVALGKLAKPTAIASTAIGYAAIASGGGSIALGGYNAQGPNATGQVSVAIGDGSNAVEYGKFAMAGGYFSATGDGQSGKIHLLAATTGATPTACTSNKAAAGSTNQLILPNNSAYAFDGIIVARQSAAAGTASAAWQVSGLIRREGTAASTTLVNSTLTVISNVPGWTLALSADTTNGGLAVTFTGAAATNIRCVSTLRTSEVTYA